MAFLPALPSVRPRPARGHRSYASRPSNSAFMGAALRRPATDLCLPSRNPVKRPRPRTTPTALDDPVLPAVKEALELLAATTISVPLFSRLKLSPILAFLVVGVILGPHGSGLIGDVEDISELAEIGVLFLLFSMGLELNLERLRKLRKYVFGFGVLQVSLTTAVLALGAYAMGATFPEAVVIGSGISLSSSAFVLQVLSEKGERQSRAGAACYGVLLLQDLATIPALVLVPLLGSAVWKSPAEMAHAMVGSMGQMGSTVGILGGVVLGGGFVLRRVFAFVAESQSSEAFTSTVLLTVMGTACLTAELGLPMTLGSFIAGVLLAESSFRSKIIVDMDPFRGLFLGLFFITTGMSMDLSLFIHEPLKMAFLVTSLIAWKTSVATLSGLPFGLSLAESLRVGLLISQGGEFTFVLFNLGNKLGFLPADVASYLITTVVATMALTPLLYETGLRLAPVIDKVVSDSGGQPTPVATISDLSSEPYVFVFGYGPVGQVVGRMLSRKFLKWVAVDIDLDRVKEGIARNLPIIYGDCLHPAELIEASELSTPSAFVVSHSKTEIVEECVDAVRAAYPNIPVYVRARDVEQQKKLLAKGALAMFPETLETSLSLGAAVLDGFGAVPSDVSAIKKELRDDGKVEAAMQEYEDYWVNHVSSPGDVIESALALNDDDALSATTIEDGPVDEEFVAPGSALTMTAVVAPPAQTKKMKKKGGRGKARGGSTRNRDGR